MRSMEEVRNRKSQRLKEFDYSEDGAYFITICTKNHVKWFGDIENGEMQLNRLGKIVDEQWKWLEMQYPYIRLDTFVVMPDHIHAIVWIDGIVGTGRDLSLQEQGKIKSMSEIIGAFKTTSSKRIHLETNESDFAWQRSFHDRIIRNERELNYIRQYIFENPMQWGMNDDNDLIWFEID